MLKIIFMGTPDFAVPTLLSLYQSNYSISAVITAPDKPSGRGRALTSSAIKIEAQNIGLPIFQPVSLSEINFIEKIKEIKPDIFIIVAFRKLPKILFQIPSIGAVNLHASLLPRYRGAAPIHHAIINGDKYTGVTTFMINDNIDTGNILLQKKIEIYSECTLGDLWGQLSHLGAKVVVETVDGLYKGSIKQKIQDKSKATFAPKIISSDYKINWNESAECIHNRIRAFSPKPGAYTIFNNLRIKLFKSNIEKDLSENNFVKSGFLSNTKTKLFFITGNGILSVSEVQLENKKRMKVESFLVGNKISKESFSDK